MDNITNLSQIDFKQLFIWIILLLVAAKFLIELFGGTIGKLLKKLDIETKTMREKREQRELLKTTAQLAKTTAENLDKLQKRHTKDEENFRNNLNNYMAESRADRKALHDEMKQFSANRVNDRQQSLQIQKELKDSISSRDVQIEALVVANKEMLAEKINEKYKYYISIQGIPEDEYDEFVSLHKAYKGVGGNSHGDAKFKYCIEHLKIIPVKTKLVIKHEE